MIYITSDLSAFSAPTFSRTLQQYGSRAMELSFRKKAEILHLSARNAFLDGGRLAVT